MKASMKLRDDRKPLARAKVPVTVLGLPFLYRISAGDPSELRLDLTTALDSGPAIRVSYHPYAVMGGSPFTLAVKTGIGSGGSPRAAPLTMSAEFGLGQRGRPSFSIVFKPAVGDFCVKKTTRSADLGGRITADSDLNGTGSVNGVEMLPIVGFQPENGFHDDKKLISSGAGGGIGRLFSGAVVSATSVLPLWSRAAVRFRWGVRVPAELQTGFGEHPMAGMGLRRLPELVVSKVSIEHVAKDREAKKGTTDDAAGFSAVAGAAAELSLVRRQLEALQAEQGMLKRAVEELRAVAGVERRATAAGNSANGGARVAGGGGEKDEVKLEKVNGDRRGEGKSRESFGKARAEDVGEELKKAILGSAATRS